MAEQLQESNEPVSHPNIPLFSPLHNENSSEHRACPADLFLSFPSHLSTPTRPMPSIHPLSKAGEVQSDFNTPSLKERISPFSFRAEFTNEDLKRPLPKLPDSRQLAKQQKKQHPCNCRVKDCGNQKCHCRKNGLVCLPECKCRVGSCVNRGYLLTPKDELLRKESSPLYEISFRKINDGSSEYFNPSDASVILYEGQGKKVVVDVRSDRIESASKKIAKRRFSQSLKKFNI